MMKSTRKVDDPIDRALRSLPLEETSPGFTASVMQELGLAPGRARNNRGVETLAAVVALALVAGALTVVFTMTGVVEAKEIPSASGFSSFISSIRGELERGVGGWLGGVVPALNDSRSIQLGLIITAIVGGIAVADRIVSRHLRPQGKNNLLRG